MPGRPRQVGFAPLPVNYSRLPHDDEKLVMRRFASHISSCSSCAPSKGDLCTKGYPRAKDVEEYIFAKSGGFYSVVDLERGKRMQVEIPGDCGVVKDLFKGIDRGLRIRGAKAATQPTGYYVPSGHAPVVERKPRVPKYDIEEPRRKHSSTSSGKSHRSHQRPTAQYAQPTAYYTVDPYAGASPVTSPVMGGYTYGPDAYGYYY